MAITENELRLICNTVGKVLARQLDNHRKRVDETISTLGPGSARFDLGLPAPQVHAHNEVAVDATPLAEVLRELVEKLNITITSPQVVNHLPSQEAPTVNFVWNPEELSRGFQEAVASLGKGSQRVLANSADQIKEVLKVLTELTKVLAETEPLRIKSTHSTVVRDKNGDIKETTTIYTYY